MQNIDIRGASSSGKLIGIYNAGTLQGFLDLEDLAAVARLILLDPASHNRARYELIGENISLEGVAQLLAKATGKSITCELLDREQYHANVTKNFKGTPEADNWIERSGRMLYYYDRRCIYKNSICYTHRSLTCFNCGIEVSQVTQTRYAGFSDESPLAGKQLLGAL